jgi:hypothetical protein
VFACKAVYNWVEKRGRLFTDEEIETDAEVAETTVKRFPFCGFRRIGKAM